MAKANHIAAWEARDRLVEELKQAGGVPVRALYIRRDDGTALALALLPERRGVALIDWRGEAYQTTYLREPAMYLTPYEQKAVGFGGMFGVGEKGSNGWTLQITERGKEVGQINLLPYITAFADLPAKNDKFFSAKRKQNQIPLWQLRPEDRMACEETLRVWERLLREGA